MLAVLSEKTKNLLRHELLNDQVLQMKRKGGDLHGICPVCGDKSVYTKWDFPGQLKCRHENNCQYEEKCTERYVHIFQNLSDSYPPTPNNPDAAVDAYMELNRGFDLSIIRGMYTAGAIVLPDKKTMVQTVRVDLGYNDDNKMVIWNRLINASDVSRNNGQKNKIYPGYRNCGWIPPDMTVKKGDTIYITEGIFKSMAFLHIGKKSIASLSTSNLPRNFIKQHANKKIKWVLAFDNDPAGLKYSKKYVAELEAINEHVMVIFPQSSAADWDDEYKAGRLNNEYLENCFWRGFYKMADQPNFKAFVFWARYRKNYFVFTFGDAYYSCKIDDSAVSDDNNVVEWGRKYKYSENRGLSVYLQRFYSFAKIRRISNCLPQFLYIEESTQTGNIYHNFKVSYLSKNPEHLISFDAGVLESASTFKRAVAGKTYGGRFAGNEKDFEKLHDLWFGKKSVFVKSIPFIGYHKESKTYVFPEFGYHNGRFIKANKHGFISTGKHNIKTAYQGIPVILPKEKDLSWFSDYKAAYGKNGLVLLAWWIGSLFAEQIREVQSSWTFLEYTGAHGAGKTTQIKFLWRCMGRADNYEGFDPSAIGNTASGVTRIMQQISNLPMSITEGDRSSEGSDNTGKKKLFHMDEFKKLYDGQALRVTGVKNNANDTVNEPFRASLLFSQNASISGSKALLSRIVHCHCTTEHFTPENKPAADRMAQVDTLTASYLLHAVLSQESYLLNQYFSLFPLVSEELRKESFKTDRLVKCHAQVMTWVLLLNDIFSDGKLCKEEQDVMLEYMKSRMRDRYHRLDVDDPHVEQFWELYEYHNIKNTSLGEMQLLNHSRSNHVIAINFTQFDSVMKANHTDRLNINELKKLLKTGKKYGYIGQEKINSPVLKKIVHCWLFKAPSNANIKQM